MYPNEKFLFAFFCNRSCSLLSFSRPQLLIRRVCHSSIPYVVTTRLELGAIFVLRKDIGVGGPENGNSPLLYVVKISYVGGWVGGSKQPYVI